MPVVPNLWIGNLPGSPNNNLWGRDRIKGRIRLHNTMSILLQFFNFCCEILDTFNTSGLLKSIN